MGSLGLGYSLTPSITQAWAPFGYGPDPIQVLCLPTNAVGNDDGTITPSNYACYYPWALAPADCKNPNLKTDNITTWDGSNAISPIIAKICDEGLNPFHAILGQKNLEWGEFTPEDFFLQPHIPGNPIEAYVSSSGVIHIKLRKDFRLSLTINQCIRVENRISKIQMAVNSGGVLAAMNHPVGLVFQNQSVIDVKTPDFGIGSKYARIFDKGISFKQPPGGTFLIDDSGVKTYRNGRFSDLKNDITIPAFYTNAIWGKTYMESAAIMLKAASHYKDVKNVDHWLINGVDISQTKAGAVRCVCGKENKIELKTSDMAGTAELITPYIRCTASLSDVQASKDKGTHVYMIAGNRRIHYDGSVMKIRCGSQYAKLKSAGEFGLGEQKGKS